MKFLVPLSLLLGLFGCLPTQAQGDYDPTHRFSAAQLQRDFALLRQALEEGHPGLYWYETKATMDSAFALTARQLNRDLTEEEFRKYLAPLIARIHCGHTGVFLSKKAERYAKTHRPPLLPFETGFYGGNLYVTANHSNDSTLQAGTQLLAIEGEPVERIARMMRGLIPSDGYNQTHKNVRISGGFPAYYRLLYGQRDTVRVSVRDSAGRESIRRITALAPRSFTASPKVLAQPVPNTPQSKPRRADLNHTLRFSERDSATALLTIYSFDERGYRRYYRRTFREITRRNCQNLIVSIRANGGGYSAAGRTLLSYLMDSTFRFSRSMVAPRKQLSFGKYLNMKALRFVVRNFFSGKQHDGQLALRSGDNPTRPARRYHFGGDVYVLTNGGTFSAAAIVAADLQAQGRATVIGRETGGGRAGCNAAYIPFLTLPESHVRIRFPLYRVLTDTPAPNLGRGVLPDHEVNYTIGDVLKNKDLDVEKAFELIRTKRAVAIGN